MEAGSQVVQQMLQRAACHAMARAQMPGCLPPGGLAQEPPILSQQGRRQTGHQQIEQGARRDRAEQTHRIAG